MKLDYRSDGKGNAFPLVVALSAVVVTAVVVSSDRPLRALIYLGLFAVVGFLFALLPLDRLDSWAERRAIVRNMKLARRSGSNL